MKKILMSAAVVSMMFASCTDNEVVGNQARGRIVTLEVNQGIDSRTTLSPTTAGYQTLWSEGDQIYVTSEDGKTTGVLTLDPKYAGEPSGTFTGYIFGNGELKNVVFPVPSNGVIDLSEQQAGEVDAPMSGTIEDGSVTLSNKVAIIKLNIIGLPENATLTISGDKIVNNAAWTGSSFEKGDGNEFVVTGAEANKNIFVPVFVNDNVTVTTLKVKVNDGTEYTLTEDVKLDVNKVSVNVPALACQDDCSLMQVGDENSGVTTVAPGEYAIQTLNTSCSTENATVWVEAGEYSSLSLKNVAQGVTIICEEGTVFEGQSSPNINGATIVGATFSNEGGTAAGGSVNGTFKNCDFVGTNGLRWCYAGETVVFEDCVFSGSVYGAHFDGGANEIVFRNCILSGFNTFSKAVTKLTFENCTFKGNGISDYNGANLWGSTEMINCEFTFDGSTTTEWIDCIGGDRTYEFKNCTINGIKYTENNYTNFEEIFSRNNATIKINGVDCLMK